MLIQILRRLGQPVLVLLVALLIFGIARGLLPADYRDDMAVYVTVLAIATISLALAIVTESTLPTWAWACRPPSPRWARDPHPHPPSRCWLRSRPRTRPSASRSICISSRAGSASASPLRALVCWPDFIVCDEPTSSLDASVQAQVLNLMRVSCATCKTSLA